MRRRELDSVKVTTPSTLVKEVGRIEVKDQLWTVIPPLETAEESGAMKSARTSAAKRVIKRFITKDYLASL